MSFVRSVLSRLADLTRRRHSDHRLDEEIRSHLEALADEYEHRGLSPEAARRAARRAFGGVTQMKEAYREQRTFALIDCLVRDLLNDLRQAHRAVRLSPGFSVVAIVTLALGIGANTALFSVADAVLLRPLPYPTPDRLVVIDGAPLSFNRRTGMTLHSDVEQSGIFNGVGTYVRGALNVGGGPEPERVSAAAVSAGFFEALGAKPNIGRVFTDDDLKADLRQAVISHAFWIRRGRSIQPGGELLINGRAFTVRGIMPPRVDFPGGADVWIPVGADHQIAGSASAPTTVARLTPGVTTNRARVEIERIADAASKGARDFREQPVFVETMQDQLVGPVRPLFLALTVAVALVLFVACINTASLLLARVSAREREISVRRALGASGFRLVRHLFCESALLAAYAGLLAVPAAMWTLAAIQGVLPATLHGVDDVAIDGRTLLVTAVLCVIATLFFGMAPACSLRGAGATGVLRGTSSPTADLFWRRFRSGLVVSELAIALVLIAGAATVVQTVRSLLRVELGVTGERALTAETTLPVATYDSPERLALLYDRLEAALRAIPGVEAAGVTNLMLGSREVGVGRRIRVAGRPAPEGAERGASYLSASPDYFRAIGLPLVAGRYFTAADGLGAPAVAILSESVARRVGLSPAEAVGQRVEIGIGQPSWATVVGVTGDVRMGGPEADPRAQLYVPLAQQANYGTTFLIVKALGDPAALAPAVRAVMAGIDSNAPLYNVQTFDQVRAGFLAERRFAMAILSAFGLLAVGLAGIGLYGVLTYLVQLRTREIGIQMALGASPGAIRWQVVRGGLLHAIVAVAIGSAASAALLRVMTSYVPGLQPADASLLATAATAVFAAMIPITWIPARRATAIDPMNALRAE
jgi:putative ABC transport system permease protein